MKNILKILSTILFLFLPSYAYAQMTGGGALLQGGPWQQGHSPMYVGQGQSQAIVMDSGAASGNGPSGAGPGNGLAEQLLIARGMGLPPYIGQGTGPFGTNWCDYDAPTTNATGYHFICLSPNIHGDAYIAVGPGGTGTPGGLTFNINGIETTYTGAMPTVFSVGAEFTGGLVSVSGSPITTSGTFDFTVAGNSGGLVYFNSPTTWTSSSPFTSGLPLIGAGAGNPPAQGTISGNTTTFGTTNGSLVNGDCVSIDANGNLIDAGGPCSTGGGGGTVAPSTANNLAYYQLSGTTVTGLATANNGTLITSNTGVPSISSTLPAAVQSNITRVGTIIAGSWQGFAIGPQFGGTGLSSFTSGGLLYSPTTTTIASSAALSNGLPVIGQGAGSAPTTGTKSGNTTSFATTSGALTSGDCIKIDASGNLIDNGSACGGIIFPATDGGTANARVIASTGYTTATNNAVSFVATSTNTGTATANVNSTGVKNIFTQSAMGPVALSGGEIVTGNIVYLSYDGTQYQILNPADTVSVNQAVPSSNRLVISYPGGTKTLTATANYIQMVSAMNGSPQTASSVSLTINGATTGANGLDTGTLATNGQYYIWSISNGTTTAGLISLSPTAPVMPSGYTYKARIGANFTNGSGNFIQGNQIGARFAYFQPPLVASGTGTISLVLTIPATSDIVTMLAQANLPGSGSEAISIRPNASFIPILVAGTTSAGISQSSYGDMIVTGSNPQIFVVVTGGSGSASANVVGWVDSITAF